jgi:hypothetical protein
MARIELSATRGSNGSTATHLYEVELPREQLGTLALAEGQVVRLHAPRLAVFPAAPPGAVQ